MPDKVLGLMIMEEFLLQALSTMLIPEQVMISD